MTRLLWGPVGVLFVTARDFGNSSSTSAFVVMEAGVGVMGQQGAEQHVGLVPFKLTCVWYSQGDTLGWLLAAVSLAPM